MQEFLTRSEAARFCCYSVSGFRKLEDSGHGPPRTRVGRKYLYRTDEVREWLVGTKHRDPDVEKVRVLGSIMNTGIIRHPDGKMTAATMQQRLDAAKALLKILHPEVNVEERRDLHAER